MLPWLLNHVCAVTLEFTSHIPLSNSQLPCWHLCLKVFSHPTLYVTKPATRLLSVSPAQSFLPSLLSFPMSSPVILVSLEDFSDPITCLHPVASTVRSLDHFRALLAGLLVLWDLLEWSFTRLSDSVAPVSPLHVFPLLLFPCVFSTLWDSGTLGPCPASPPALLHHTLPLLGPHWLPCRPTAQQTLSLWPSLHISSACNVISIHTVIPGSLSPASPLEVLFLITKFKVSPWLSLLRELGDHPPLYCFFI